MGDPVREAHPGHLEPIPAAFFFFFKINKFIYLFTYFGLCWVFIAARGLVVVRRLLIMVASLVVEHGL